MEKFISANDLGDISSIVKDALNIKQQPYSHKYLGENKTLGLLFFNSSLRTRMSTQKAAANLGMNVMVMNVAQDSWQLEIEDGVIMRGDKAEHIREAAAVLGTYCDILGVRSFPGLEDQKLDYEERIINAFVIHSGVPVVSLESATLHPLQSFADMITIEELKQKEKPKVVMSWAPHIKPLPQAVANSFAQWATKADMDLTIVQPHGFELSEAFTKGAKISYDQQEAFDNADFVYVKNWSSYKNYGEVGIDESWIIDQEKLKNSNNAKVMHCLPVRRNVVISDDVLDSESSVVIQQAANRVFSAQAVLKSILQTL